MKVLFVIGSPLYARNYLQSNAFDALGREDILLAVNDTVAVELRVSHHGTWVGTFHYPSNLLSRYLMAFTLLAWRYRHRSRTFAYRFHRLYSVWSQPCRTPLGRLRRMMTNLAYRIGGSRLLAPLALAVLRRRLPPNTELAAIIVANKPDLVVVPTGLMDPIANDTARICRRLGISSLFLVDNWDGMVSKTIMWDAPDYVGAWGEQTRHYATSIHGIPPDRTFAIGTPRFQAYYDEDDLQPRLYDFSYALFCGCAVPFDELGALRELDREIGAHPSDYRGLRIVYRPHPWRQKRQCPDLFRETDFQHIVIDRQVCDNYYNPKGQRFQPSLGYYKTLLRDAELVVGPPTSMTIEALICGRRVVTIAYDDGVHIESPHNTCRHYMNLDGIENIAGNTLVTARADLGERFRLAICNPAPPDTQEIRRSLDYFLVQGPGTYADRLRDVVKHAAGLTPIRR